MLQDSVFYPPSAEFAAQANAGADLYAAAEKDRLGFWAEKARRLHWHTPFTEVLDWPDAPVAKWFTDGELNVAYNCVDRHVIDGHGDQVAIHWEGEPGDSRDFRVERYMREAETTQIFEGTNQIQRLVLARSLASN